jgi:hypothetical protein
MFRDELSKLGDVSKSVPQRLKPSSVTVLCGTAKPVPFVRTFPQPVKPSSAQAFTARLKPCPSFDSLSQPLKVSDGFMCYPN